MIVQNKICRQKKTFVLYTFQGEPQNFVGRAKQQLHFGESIRNLLNYFAFPFADCLDLKIKKRFRYRYTALPKVAMQFSQHNASKLSGTAAPFETIPKRRRLGMPIFHKTELKFIDTPGRMYPFDKLCTMNCRIMKTISQV